MAEEQTESYHLYKLEVVLEEGQLLTVVVIANTDERAFSSAENNLLRHTIAPPRIKQLSLVEKKPLGRQGVGYVVETSTFS
jgi:signal transduction protein with GAF and PtsI domain